MLRARRERQQPKGASGAPRTQSKEVPGPAAEPWAPLRSPRPGLWRHLQETSPSWLISNEEALTV